MGSEWILGRLAWGCGLESTGTGQGPVAGCCECGDEPSGSCATELVSLLIMFAGRIKVYGGPQFGETCLIHVMTLKQLSKIARNSQLL
jgi:hypothetical protein